MPDQYLLRGIKDPSTSQFPVQPITDLYQMFNVGKPFNQNIQQVALNTPVNSILNEKDPLKRDVDPLQTSLSIINPYLNEDAIGNYGYSDLLNRGDNEDRYAQGYKRENPNKFYSGYNPLKYLYKGGFWTGAFLEKTLESAVVKTGQGLSNLYGLTVGNGIGMLQGESYEGFSDWLSKSTDNMFNRFFDGWDEWLKGRYNFYQEKADRDNKGFIASLGDGDFWLNDVSDGVGFLVSSMLEAGLISKIGLGTKVASRIAPLAEGVSTEALVAENLASKAGLGMATRALNAIGIEGTGNLLVKNAVDLTATTLALTAIESATEADEVKKKIYDSLFYKVNPETGTLYTEEEKKRLAAEGAAQTFKQNMAILIGPKFLETLVFNNIGKALKSRLNKGAAQAEAGKASNLLSSEGLSAGTSLRKASMLANVWKVGSLASVGFLSEGLWEENVQLAISREAEENFGAGEFYRPSSSEKEIDSKKSGALSPYFGDVNRRYLNQLDQFFKGASDFRYLDDELSKSIGIGGLFGVVGGGVHGTINIRQQTKIDNYWNNRIGQATRSLFESSNFYQTRIEDKPDPENPGKTKPTEVIVTDSTTGQPVLDENKLKGFLDRVNNIQGIMDIIGNTEDTTDESNKTVQNQEFNKLARNVLFTQLAMEYIKAGKKNLLLQNLASASQFSDKDVQSLGYVPGMMSEQNKKDMLAKMTNIVNRLDEANNWIDNNVLDNVSEKREGKFGISYTKTQKERRRDEFEAKKAYLRGLAMQNALLNSYLDDINTSESKLIPTIEEDLKLLSSVFDLEGNEVTDLSVPLASVENWNQKIPALRNQISALEKEYAHYFDQINKATNIIRADQEVYEKPSDLWTNKLEYFQVKAQETLDRINDLQENLDKLSSEKEAWMTKNKNSFEVRNENGNDYVFPKREQNNLNLQALEDNKTRRLNAVKREEIAIQMKWIEEEWRKTAALKEEKINQERKETRLSRRMLGSTNAYNQYFQREVQNKKDDQLVKSLTKHGETVDRKRYVSHETKVLKAVRIRGKVMTILAQVNGQKLLAEINALLEKDLDTAQFSEELKNIIDAYNGKPMILSASEKDLVSDQIDETQDELDFVNSIMEFQPTDDRFNDKYYDVDPVTNQYVIKPEYDDFLAIGEISKSLSDRIDDLQKVRKFLKSIPEEVPGDWNNVNLVKKRIADDFMITADSIIDNYNQVSNNGQSEISGDSLSTQQDLNMVEAEIKEIEQLKTIFQERPDVLSAEEFRDFTQNLDKKIETLNKIRDAVKERLSSRLRENQDFLIDTVNNLVEQVGLSFDGTTKNDDIKKVVESVVGSDIYSKLVNNLTDLKALIDKEDKSAEDKKAINNAYWSINGQLSAIQEIIKNKDVDKVNQEISKQKRQEISNLQSTALMKKIAGTSYYKDIINNLNDSLLGSLQVLFFQNEFSQVGVASTGSNEKFLDDLPSSPVYRFREDYNLRKFVRNVERDNSRTPDNTDIGKEDLLEFLNIALKIQTLEDLQSNLNSQVNLIDQVDREKQVIQEKTDKKDNKFENLIVPSIQQLFFIRKIANFLRSNKIQTQATQLSTEEQVNELAKTHYLFTHVTTTADAADIISKGMTVPVGTGLSSTLTQLGANGVNDQINRLNRGEVVHRSTDNNSLALIAVPKSIVDKIQGTSISEKFENYLAENNKLNSKGQYQIPQEYHVGHLVNGKITGIEKFVPQTQNTTNDNPGFRNWIYIQAPGGAGKTQTLGTWFNIISGIPRDRVLATAFTEEASRSIKKALLVGEDGPKDAVEMATYIRELTKNKQYDHDVLIIDEFPAISIDIQKELYDAITEYTKAKLKAGKGEFKVVTMGDTNQLTFGSTGSVIPRPSIIINPNVFNNNKKGQNDNHPAKMTIIPSLTVNFRSNIFAITSFIDTFRGSSEDVTNKEMKVTSTDPTLQDKDIKGVVSLEKTDFTNRVISYLKANESSTRTKVIIVNESKIDQYKKLLTDSGIKIINDPNDEITKGVYVTTVKNVQGFSFDEVFVDLENNDKTLFSGTSNPEYIYNKAMYVAASRARNLLVTTNFPNFQNVEDQSINQLENKSLNELQTKDEDFIAQRDLEIDGAKSILGDQYAKSVVNQAPEKAEGKVETPLDPEEDIDEEQVEVEEEQEKETPNSQVETPEEQPYEEGVDESKGNEIIPTDGVEDNSTEEDKELVQPSEGGKASKQTIGEMWNKIKDQSEKVFNKMKDNITELLFPTAQTTKYKIADGQFTVRPEDGFENQNLRVGDKVIVIPFQQSQNAKSSRNFGYAVITPALDESGKPIENSYRTVAILSDNEINKFKENPTTTNLFTAISENETRGRGFVSITYQDVSDENGFITSSSKVINELHEGVVAYSQPVKYFYGDTYRDMNRQTMDGIIDEFIDNFYANHLTNFPVEQRQIERDNIRRFYQNTDNAQIIIPTRKDIEGPRPLLKVPPELRSYVRAGRPYFMFRPYHARSSMQFIGLSRKFLNTNLHDEQLAPIRDFINSAKAIKRLLESKGIDNKMGYSKSLSNMLSKLSNSFVKDPNQNEYTVTMTSTRNNQRITRTFTFTNTEAERIYNTYAMYSEPNTQMIKSETEREIQNLTKIRRARNYIFDDGTVIYGTIESYDPNTRTFVVKDLRAATPEEEFQTKSGVIHHSSKSYVGKAQQALDDIFNSNGHIASRFTSTQGRIGFVTDKNVSGVLAVHKGYKFMSLFGSKTAPVPKSYNEDGTVREYYEDVIEILEDLFNFADRGELPGKQFTYIDNEGTQQAIEMKFRVPVSINARDEAGNLVYDYSFSSQNTSRDTTVPNSRFFDTSFESMLPTRVFVDFTQAVEEVPSEEIAPAEVPITEQPLSEEERIEQTRTSDIADIENAREGSRIIEDITRYEWEGTRRQAPGGRYEFGYGIVDGILETGQIWIRGWQNPISRQVLIDWANLKAEQALADLRRSQAPVTELTREQIQSLPFEEIRGRLTPEQVRTLDEWSRRPENGFNGVDHFFEVLFSSHPEEQEIFRDYLIECLL